MGEETAFCTNCGAVVGGAWEFCGACGARQPVDVAAIGEVATEGMRDQPGRAAGVASPARAAGQQTPTGTYLVVGGGVLCLIGIVLFFSVAGFPPEITTTYEYGPDGSVSTSTSPSLVQVGLYGGLFLLGSLLIRAGGKLNGSGVKDRAAALWDAPESRDQKDS